MPGSSPLQRCFFSGGLSASLWLRRGSRAVGEGCSRLLGWGSRSIFSLRSRLASLRLRVGGMAWLLQVVGGSLLLVQRVIRLGMKLSALVGSSSLGSNPICVVCAGSSFYHGGGLWAWARSRVGAWAQWLARVWSCLRFKEWSSMPFQWPRALPPHLRTSYFRFLICFSFCFSLMSAALVGLSKSEGFVGILPSFFIPSLLRQAMALAAPITVRRFSMASSVWWFSCYWPLHLTFGLRSHPSTTWAWLSFLWWCARQLCAGWAQVMEYGSCGPFCSVRHLVQVVSRPNKCSVWLLKVW